MAWELATTSQHDAPFVAVLIRTAKWSLDGWNAQELANTAWAFATAGESSDTGVAHPSFWGIQEWPLPAFPRWRAAERRLGQSSARELAKTVWAFTPAGETEVPLFVALARTSECPRGLPGSQELADTAWALATASQHDAPLFAALARAV